MHQNENKKNNLQKGVLSQWETFAQSIAGIAPSATPGLLIPLVFGFAGNGTWLSYFLATLGMLFTAQCINEFASRFSSPGSLYSFVLQSFGKSAGILTGWALLFAYVMCCGACVTEFAIYAISLSKHLLNLDLAACLMMFVAAVIVAYVAYKNIKMSASLMLRLEFISVGLILLIVFFTIIKNGSKLDLAQLSLAGVNFENVRMGLVMAIFGFAAFESSASLGTEASAPLKTIPQAIMASVIFSGLFFMLTSYAMVMCFSGANANLAKCSTPLLTMSNLIGMPQLGHLINAGIMISFFAAALANLNAGARALYQMSQDGLFHSSLGQIHEQNSTPHVAVFAVSIFSFIVALVLTTLNFSLMDIVGWLGTLATFGFIYAYMAVTVAAAKLLKTENAWRAHKFIVIVVSLLVLLFSLVGSLYPAPVFPYNILPFIFIAYMVIGVVLGYLAKKDKVDAK